MRPEEIEQQRRKYDLDFSELHKVISPADIRRTDRVGARIRNRSQGCEFEDVSVWKMSPLAVEIVNPNNPRIVKGASVDLELTIAGQRILFEGLVVDRIEENENISLVGIRITRRIEKHDGQDRRRSPRWLCPDEFFPTCVTASHVSDYIIFQIRDISPQGMQLFCSLRNKTLVKGMRLRLTCNFPTIGDFVTTAKITRVSIVSHNGKDKLSLGVEFINLTDEMRQVIGQYLVQFSNVGSLDELREQGLRPHSIAAGIDFYYLKSEEDYRKVLSLRRLAYDEHIAKENVADTDMGDINDGVARILVGKHKNKVVTTARIRFNRIDQPLEHEGYVEWPKSLPRRNQIIEVSRVCTHPEYRKGDLLAGLFEFACSTSIQQERPFVLISSIREMVPFYEKVGFTSTGLSHSEPMWNKTQHVMIADSFDCMVGKGVNPIFWNVIWRNASAYAIANGTIVPNKVDEIRIGFFRTLQPLVSLLQKYRRIWKRISTRR